MNTIVRNSSVLNLNKASIDGLKTNIEVVNITANTTITAAHLGKKLVVNSGSAVTLTFPQQSTEITVVGDRVEIENIGAGDVTIAKEGSETLSGNSLFATGAKGRVSRNTSTNWSIEGGTLLLEYAEKVNVETAANATYLIDIPEFAGTITKVTSKSRSGTITATVSINATPLGGTANSVSSTAEDQAHASDNAFAAGDVISVAGTSNSSCLDMLVIVKGTRRVNI